MPEAVNNMGSGMPFIPPQHLVANFETTILDLYDWNAIHNSDAPLLRYAVDEGVINLSWVQVNEASHRAASILQAKAGAVRDERPVLAIFANAGTLILSLVTLIIEN